MGNATVLDVVVLDVEQRNEQLGENSNGAQGIINPFDEKSRSNVNGMIASTPQTVSLGFLFSCEHALLERGKDPLIK